MLSRLLLVLIVTPLLAGCDLDGIREQWNKGTIKGYNLCKAAGEKEGLSQFTVKQICASRHQQRLVAKLTGKAGYVERFGKLSFTGTVKNETDAAIITEYTIGISHSAGPRETHVIKNVWVEPGQIDVFTIDSDDLKHAPTGDATTRAQNFDWDAGPFQGIKVAF
jgi:hypothetical protein